MMGFNIIRDGTIMGFASLILGWLVFVNFESLPDSNARLVSWITLMVTLPFAINYFMEWQINKKVKEASE